MTILSVAVMIVFVLLAVGLLAKCFVLAAGIIPFVLKAVIVVMTLCFFLSLLAPEPLRNAAEQKNRTVIADLN